MRLSEIKPYKKNAKKHDETQIKNVMQSIKEFGVVQPIVVDRTNTIIIGHCRYEAMKRLGFDELQNDWVKVVDLSEQEAEKLRLLDNKLNESEWNFELLKDLVPSIDFSDFEVDFNLPEDIEENTEIEEDEAPEPPTEPKAKLGDLWQLGSHRLICGDSTDVAVIDRLMDGVKADMVFTDPPYGMKKESEGVLNDNLNFDDLLDFNRQWIPLTFGALKDNGSWYCWGIDEPLMDIYSEILKPMIRENKITFRNLITWDKGNGQGQLNSEFRMYPIADEKCLFVVRGIQCLTLNADNYWEKYEPIRKYLYDSRIAMGWDVTTMKKIVGHSELSRDHWTSKSQFSMPTKEVYEKLKSEAEKQRKEKGIENDAFCREYDDLRREYDDLRAYFDNTHDNMNNVWHFDRAGKDEREHTGGHATPKPIALCSRAIKSSSREGEICLDVFGGSGSTLIACEQLNRVCYMCELDPRYCDVIVKRWENFTGKKAVKLN